MALLLVCKYIDKLTGSAFRANCHIDLFGSMKESPTIQSTIGHCLIQPIPRGEGLDYAKNKIPRGLTDLSELSSKPKCGEIP